MLNKFKAESFRRIDYWGIGCEFSVQYKYLDEEHLIKQPVGVALILCLMTREFRLGYFWR